MSSRTRPLIAVSMGDPAGIGPEVVLKAAGVIMGRSIRPTIVVVGNLDVMRETASRLEGDLPTPIEWDRRKRLKHSDSKLPVVNTGKLPLSARIPGAPTVDGAHAAYRYVFEAAQMTIRGEADALVTAPINKEWLNRAGHHFPGHSELLARLAHVRRWRMMFAGETLRIALVTVHIGLAQVPRALTRDAVLATITLLDEHLRTMVGIARPRILVLGFNPHAGENGLFGDEEARVISPAIRQARGRGVDAHGPVAPDTAFIRAGRDQPFGFDGAVAMYHDQGLIALKALEFDHAVNITLGLPFVRTSPDHGTAYDIAGRGLANAASMVAAIEYAAKAAHGRRKPDKEKSPRRPNRFLRTTQPPRGSGRTVASRDRDVHPADSIRSSG